VCVAAPFRLLIFADPCSRTSTRLVAAALDAVAGRPGIDVAGIVDTASRAPSRAGLPREAAARLALRAFNRRGLATGVDRRPLTSLRRLARRQGVPLLAPREAGVNDAGFVAEVRALRPDAGLALMVPKIFGRELLAACGLPANYHNGLLPGYRGVAATEWSVYAGAERSGFTFHRMTAGIDEGPVLLQDAVRVPGGWLPGDVERAKTALAASRMGAAIDLLVAHAPGIEQEGTSRRFTRAETAAIVAVGDPASLTWDELERRVRAFEAAELEIAGERWPVTRLRRLRTADRGGPLAFTTADGVRAQPSRCMHLPTAIYRGLRRLSGRASDGAGRPRRPASRTPASDRAGR
jgi:methionyl-tRNA formyltransferase